MYYHFDVVNFRETSDEEIDRHQSGSIRVVHPVGSDAGVVDSGAHHGVQDLLLLLPGRRIMCQTKIQAFDVGVISLCSVY